MRPTPTLVLAAFVGVLAAPLPVEAQVQRPGDVRPKLPELEKPREEPELRLPPPPPAPVEEKDRLSRLARVFVRDFRFRGNTVFGEEELDAVVADFTNRGITSEELHAARDAVTRYYVERGYVSSGAMIPDQDVVDGIVELQVVEGTLAEVEVEGNRYFRSGYLERRLEPSGEGPLNVHDVQQRLEILRRDERIERVNAELVPAERRGEALLRVRVDEESPYRLALEFGNTEPPSIGSERLQLEVGHQNLTGNGDELSGTFGWTEGLREIDARYEIPINARDTSLALWYSGSDSDLIEDSIEDFDIESEASTYGFGIRHPLRRSLEDDLSLGLNAELRRSKTFLFGEGFPIDLDSGADEDGVSKVSVLRFYQEWLHRDREQVVALRSTFSWGLDAFRATENSGSTPDGQFLAWLGQAQWLRRLPWWGIETVCRFDTQLSTDPLLSLEQLAIGGHASVRGYRENEIVRDMGVVASVEARIPLWSDSDGRPILQLAPFVDYGRSKNRSRDTPRPSTLAGAGIGLRWSIARRLFAEAYWAEELREVDEPPDRDLQDTGVYFRVRLDVL